jgi:hypothetical protein
LTPEQSDEKRIDFATPAKYGAVGIGIALLARAVFKLFGGRLNEDRPPIIIRNGSVIIEQAPRRGKAKHPDWGADGNEWKPDHPEGADVTTFRVSVTDPEKGDCEDLVGDVVKIFHSGSSVPITFRITGNKQPRVGPKGQLAKIANKRRTLAANGTAKEVNVNGKSCLLSSEAVVWIWPE